MTAVNVTWTFIPPVHSCRRRCATLCIHTTPFNSPMDLKLPPLLHAPVTYAEKPVVQAPGHWSYRCELASAPCDFNLHIPCAKLVVDPFEEMRMQSISPLEVPRHNSAAAVDSSAAPSSTGVAAQVGSVMQSGLEAQVELMKIQNKMMVASAVFDVQRACALSLYRRY